MSTRRLPLALRLLPPLLGLAAVSVLMVGIWLQKQANDERALRAEAYLAGPPVSVPLDTFAPRRDASPYGEARLTAQLDIAAARRVSGAETGAPGLAIPLHRLDATEGAAPVGLALFAGKGYSELRVTPEGLAAMAAHRGPIGPVVELNGWLGDPGEFDRVLTSPTMVRAAAGHVIHPFVAGRRAAFLPEPEEEGTVFGRLARIAGGFGLAALVLAALRRRPAEADAKDARDEPPAEVTLPRVDTSPAITRDEIVQQSPVRKIMAGMFLALVAAISVLELLPVLIARYEGLARTYMVARGWVMERVVAALAGDLLANAMFAMFGLAVILLILRLTIHTGKAADRAAPVPGH